MQHFSFRQAGPDDGELIATWFGSPHVTEFWGESDVNIRAFADRMSGIDDLFDYWIGCVEDIPFSLLLTSNAATDEPEHLMPYQPEMGEAWTLDVLIGDEDYIGRGLAVPMIRAFMEHAKTINPALTKMFIDPEERNNRAKHVYEKAGFETVSIFFPVDGPFSGKPHNLMAYDFPS